MTQILNIAFALLIGLLMTRLFSKRHLPDVTAFLVAGVLIGPFILGRAGIPGVGFSTYDDVAGLSDISNGAMGFIAFSIGSEKDREKGFCRRDSSGSLRLYFCRCCTAGTAFYRT